VQVGLRDLGYQRLSELLADRKRGAVTFHSSELALIWGFMERAKTNCSILEPCSSSAQKPRFLGENGGRWCGVDSRTTKAKRVWRVWSGLDGADDDVVPAGFSYDEFRAGGDVAGFADDGDGAVSADGEIEELGRATGAEIGDGDTGCTDTGPAVFRGDIGGVFHDVVAAGGGENQLVEEGDSREIAAEAVGNDHGDRHAAGEGDSAVSEVGPSAGGVGEEAASGLGTDEGEEESAEDEDDACDGTDAVAGEDEDFEGEEGESAEDGDDFPPVGIAGDEGYAQQEAEADDGAGLGEAVTGGAEDVSQREDKDGEQETHHRRG
jgi:hypothetical protein